MRTLYLFFIALFISGIATAGCPPGRYNTEVFTGYTKTTVTYSSVYSLQMDIFQPTGDTLAERPVIILGHGGSFITGNGDRTNDSTIIWLCQNFAKRGYVTVSIDYRTTSPLTLLDSASAVDEVIKAIGDGKAAIRYFVKDRATTNTYKIDTNNIFIGGNSAGAVLYMHVGYLDSLGECPPNIAAAMMANGGFEGNSGNAGYTTRFKAIINLAGALNQSSFAGIGDKPSVNAQGTNDNVVPYYCGYPLSGTVHVNLCGLGTLEPVYVANGIYHMSHIFPGDGHVPWSTNAAKFFTVDSMINVFLYQMVCTEGDGIHEAVTGTVDSISPMLTSGLVNIYATVSIAEVSVFPNPASELVKIKATVPIAEVTVYDQTGRTVLASGNVGNANYEMNTSHLAKGIYFLHIRYADQVNAPVVKRLVIE